MVERPKNPGRQVSQVRPVTLPRHEHCPLVTLQKGRDVENSEQEHGVQPSEVRLKKSCRQLSQSGSLTPGLHGQMPSSSEQSCDVDPTSSHMHAENGIHSVV